MTRIANQETRREELLDCAAALIAERGLQACTFRNLAKRAGASTMTFTYYFPTRDALFRALLARACDLAWDSPKFEEPDSEDPLDALREASCNAVQLEPELDPYKQIYDQIQLAAPYHPQWLEMLREVEERMLPKYLRLIVKAQEAGQISAEIIPEDLMRKIWAVGDGLNIQRYIDDAQLSAEESRRLFIDAFRSLTEGHAPAG